MSDVFSTFDDTSGLGAGSLSDFFGGSSGADLSGTFNNLDPSVFGGGGSDLGSLAAMALGGLGGGGNPVQSANSTSALQTIADPTSVAQDAVTGGQTAPQGAQGQSQGQGPGQGQGGQNQSTPTAAIDMLKKALTGLKQQQRQNPYQIGGPNYGPDARQLNRAARIPTGAAAPIAPAAPNPADIPTGDAMNVDALYNAEGESNQPEYGPGLRPGGPDYNSEGASNQPEYGPGLRPGGPDYNSEGASNDPEYGYGQPKPEVHGPNVPYPEGDSYQPEYGPGFPAGSTQVARPGSLGELVQRLFNGQAGPPPPVEGLPPPSNPLIPLWRRGMGWPWLSAGMQAAQPSPLQQATGVEAPRTLGRSPSGPAQPAPADEKGYRPEDDPSFTKPGVTKAPDTGKPVQHVNPKTKKPVDPKTGDPLPTKKPHEEEGEYQPKPGTARDKVWVPGQQRMTQELTGGQGIPSVLGNLARIAMPLIAMGLMGGFGRRGGGRVGRFWGHPGGFGGLNRFYGPRPGGGMGGFLPGALMGGMLGSSMGGGGQQGPLGYAGSDGAPPQYNQYFDKHRRYQNQDPPSSSVIGKGPDGQALPFTGEQVASFTDRVAGGLGIDPKVARQILAGESSYGQNYTNPNDTDGYPSFGPFQLHMKPGAMGWRFKQATGEDPRDPSTWRDQIVFALREAAKTGWGQWGAARDHGIAHMAGIPRGGGKQFAWNYGKENGGVTATGGSNKPNPDGNKNTDLAGKPPETASAE